MEFHPSQIPIEKTFDITEESQAEKIIDEMINMGFHDRKNGFKVLMPKDQKKAKRIGFTITTGVSYMLRKRKQERNVKYWTYHHDPEHYAIVMISGNVLEELGF